MKTTITALFLAAFSLSLCHAQLSADDFAGSWARTFSSPEGESYEVVLTFKADNSYEVEWTGDTTPEITGKFTLDGDQMTMMDNKSEGSCEVPGVYQISLAGDNVTIALVSDECEPRKGDGKPKTWTRK